ATRSISTTVTEIGGSKTSANPLATQTRITAAGLPALFSAFRPTLAVWLLATGGSASALLENLTLVLPSQPGTAGELVEQIDDQRARVLTVGLSALGTIVGLVSVIGFILRWVRRRTNQSKRSVKAGFVLPAVAIVAAGVVYFIANFWLFHLGTPHFDVYAAKMWSYIAANYNFADLY